MNFIHQLSTSYWTRILLIAIMLTSCEDYLEIDPPSNQLTGTVVFENAATVDAAFAHIYSQLRETAFTSGTLSGLSYLMGLYADELELYANFPEIQTYANNSVLPSDSNISQIWNTGYSLIYSANSILEGVQNSTALSPEDKDRFLGEAYFIRAFVHFYLVNLFGPIPYIDSTDYRLNSKVSRLEEEKVYQRLIEDLIKAKDLLLTTDNSSERIRPNHWVASALLARVYLYSEDWTSSLAEANHVISDGGYLLEETEQVFLKGSTGTLWQLGPGISGTNTHEAHTFVILSTPPANSALSNYLVNDFEAGDARFNEWVNSISDGTNTWYYPYKYKLYTLTATSEEYSIMFRLAELYLIAAEAQAQLGSLPEALANLNIIRNRASLPSLTSMGQEDLLTAIYQERRIEFFAEQGHRFFDLKRTGRANAVLSPIKPNWEGTDILLPLPESELVLNPNLLPQNEGY